MQKQAVEQLLFVFFPKSRDIVLETRLLFVTNSNPTKKWQENMVEKRRGVGGSRVGHAVEVQVEESGEVGGVQCYFTQIETASFQCGMVVFLYYGWPFKNGFYMHVDVCICMYTCIELQATEDVRAPLKCLTYVGLDVYVCICMYMCLIHTWSYRRCANTHRMSSLCRSASTNEPAWSCLKDSSATNMCNKQVQQTTATNLCNKRHKCAGIRFGKRDLRTWQTRPKTRFAYFTKLTRYNTLQC